MNKQPIRCFEGTTKPHEPFWTVRNAVETGGEPEMELYGYISEFSWFEDDVTPKLFKDALYNLGNGGPITVRMNSGGGDVIAASMIRSIMSDYPGHITVRIDGLAASAAVIVAIAGKTVKIMDTAYMMIHDPAVALFMAVLDINTLGGLLDSLKSVKTGIMETYQAKTGLSIDRLNKMMVSETWMSASEAVNYGFADEVISGGQQASNRLRNAAFINALQNYEHVPAALAAVARDGDIPRTVINPAVEILRAEVRLYAKGA
jgi:ATP-dependent Clp protease protease subunit